MKLLKDETNLVGTKAIQLGRAHGGHVNVVDLQLAGRRPIQTSDQIHQRALARPDGPVIATHSPATIENEASANARTTPPCPTYSRVT